MSADPGADRIIERGRRVLRLEQEALGAAVERLGAEFAHAVALIKAALEKTGK